MMMIICLDKAKMPLEKWGNVWYNIKAIRTSEFSAVVFPFSGIKAELNTAEEKIIFINQEDF